MIITVEPNEPLAGKQYELAGTIAQRSGNLTTFAQAIALVIGLDPKFVEVVGSDVLVEGVVRYKLTDGYVDRPVNNRLSNLVRWYVRNHQSDPNTNALHALRMVIRYAKNQLGMTKTAFTNIVSTVWDNVTSDED